MARNLKFILILLLSIFILAACSETEETDASIENNTVDIEQLVNEYSAAQDMDVAASITSHELIVTDQNEEEIIYDLPEDKFFISIAPFEEVTHPCTHHSLDGCQGEMVNEEFLIEIMDSEGKLIVEEPVKTMENGFIDYWLPRNDDYQVKLTHDGKVAEEILSTYEGDRTCVTTMQLQDDTEA